MIDLLYSGLKHLLELQIGIEMVISEMVLIYYITWLFVKDDFRIEHNFPTRNASNGEKMPLVMITYFMKETKWNSEVIKSPLQYRRP